MKARCENPKNPKYYRYGARGITVCRRWAESFEAFLSDMGERPSPHHSIDRINNNGNYDPGNCRWATPLQQARNTRRNRQIEAGGFVGTVAEVAAKLGIKVTTMRGRVLRGSYGTRYVSPPAG
jgi:hypothetical protein